TCSVGTSGSDDRLHARGICLGGSQNFGQYLLGMVCIFCLEKFMDDPRERARVRLGRDGPSVSAEGQGTDRMECQDCRACGKP
ncbi:MAG: hypothetical protein ACREOH_03950, partial [Candidatus Entotheonellia bacterium]